MSGTRRESWLGGWRSSVEGGGGPRPNYSVSMTSIMVMMLVMMVMMVSWAKNCNNNQWLMIWWLNVILLSTSSEYFYSTKNLFATRECQVSRPNWKRDKAENKRSQSSMMTILWWWWSSLWWSKNNKPNIGPNRCVDVHSCLYLCIW